MFIISEDNSLGYSAMQTKTDNIIGYNSRTVTYEDLEQIYEKEKQEIDDRRIQEWLLAI